MNFSKGLKQLMFDRGETIKSLSFRLGVSPSVVHGWLNGHRPRDYQKLLELLNHFNVSLGDLMTAHSKTGALISTDSRSAIVEISGIRLKITLEP